MPVSNRHQYAARKSGANQGPATSPYMIKDPHFKPDLRGQFAGGFVPRRMAGQWVVDMTEAQAQFHLDQGTIAPMPTEEPAPASPPPAVTTDEGSSKKGK